MQFIQIIEFTTTRFDEVEALMNEWVTKTEGKRKARRATVTADRDKANTYVQIVEFPSYEEAMANSNLPETAGFAEKIAEHVRRPGHIPQPRRPPGRRAELIRDGQNRPRRASKPPDETRVPGTTEVDVVALGPGKAVPFTFQTGWRRSAPAICASLATRRRHIRERSYRRLGIRNGETPSLLARRSGGLLVLVDVLVEVELVLGFGRVDD